MGRLDRGDAETVMRLLIDDAVRKALSLVDGQALSVKELADRCDVSGPTMYRKVNVLEELDLLEAETRIDPDGNHVTVFRSNVDRIDVSVDPSEDDLGVEVVRRRSADRFKDLWSGLKEQ